MLIIDEDVERKLAKVLEAHRANPSRARCIYFKLMSRPPIAGMRDRIIEATYHHMTELNAEVYFCEDGDCFILASSIATKDGNQIILDIGDFLGIPVTSEWVEFFETSIEASKLLIVVGEKIELIRKQDEATRKQLEQSLNERKRQIILNSGSSVKLDEISRRRAARTTNQLMMIEDDAFSRKLVENVLQKTYPILDFSKIEAGALVLEHIAFNFNETMQQATSLLKPTAERKNLDLTFHCDSDVPAYLWGDSGRLRQIITNLIGNAVKFTERGHVRLKSSLQEGKNGSMLHVSIEDTGMGIPTAKLNEIFDKFTQADTSVTRKYGGTGLGLAITRQLVKLMDGEIGVESAEGKGSTFWFTVPCQPANRTDVHSALDHRGIQCIAVANRIPINEAKILLVEDYPVNQVFAEKLLRKFGFTHIDLAENGLEALKKYRTNTYDMIFMDCQMPELDGYQTTEKLRLMEDGIPVHTPIVAMTANAMMGDREKCLKAGMDDYLSKPLRAEHLKKLIESWFIIDETKPIVLVANNVIEATESSIESPVDLEQLRMFTDGDAEEEKALADLFIEQANMMIDLLQKSTDAVASDTWKSAAHRFKGSSGNLGANKLHHLCRRAETHYDDSEEEKREMLQAIVAETQRVQAFFAKAA